MSEYPHTLNLNLTIAGEGNDWDEVAICLKNEPDGWELCGKGPTFKDAVANLLSAIDNPPEYGDSALIKTLQQGGDGLPSGVTGSVQGNYDPWVGSKD
jgi:hypothetical protein